MLRIERILRLEGDVVGPWVAELARSADQALASGTKLTLDLTDVAFVDRSGAELLRTLMRAGVVVVKCSPFVQTQIGV